MKLSNGDCHDRVFDGEILFYANFISFSLSLFNLSIVQSVLISAKAFIRWTDHMSCWHLFLLSLLLSKGQLHSYIFFHVQLFSKLRDNLNVFFSIKFHLTKTIDWVVVQRDIGQSRPVNSTAIQRGLRWLSATMNGRHFLAHSLCGSYGHRK